MRLRFMSNEFRRSGDHIWDLLCVSEAGQLSSKFVKASIENIDSFFGCTILGAYEAMLVNHELFGQYKYSRRGLSSTN